MFNTYGSCGTSAYTGASMTISIKRDFDWRSFTNLLSCLVTRTHISAIHTRNKYRSCCYSREIALSIKCRRGRKTKTTQKKKEPKKSFVNQAHPRDNNIIITDLLFVSKLASSCDTHQRSIRLFCFIL
jgi:hypothetical protein